MMRYILHGLVLAAVVVVAFAWWIFGLDIRINILLIAIVWFAGPWLGKQIDRHYGVPDK